MNKSAPILSCEIDDITAIITKIDAYHNLEYLPVGVSTATGDLRRALNYWWSHRSIPASRHNLKDALRDLNMKNKNELIVKALGLSLSDQYWINPDGELKWEDINFFTNPFSDDVGDILIRQPDASRNPDLRSPDNTSDGVLKKRWKIINGKRVLIKGGSGTERQEPLNETFVSKIIKTMNYENYVEYHVGLLFDDPYCFCENFVTPDTEFVNAERIMSVLEWSPDTPIHQHFLNCCEHLEIPDPTKHLNFMVALDYLIRNTDRHIGNFGAIRDVNTLRFIGMAPLFDNGTSLWNQDPVNKIDPFSTYTAKPFDESSIGQLKLVKTFIHFDTTQLQGIELEFYRLLDKAPTITGDRRDALVDAFAKRVVGMEKLIGEIERSRFTQVQ